MAEATGPGDGNMDSATKQNYGTPTIDDQVADPKLGKNGKLLVPRAKTRGDGSIRTPSHPDYVSLEEAPLRLGDRQFRPNARGSGWKQGGGGGGGGGGGAGGSRNGGVYFGWRRGRGRGAKGGANMHNGQSSQARGK